MHQRPRRQHNNRSRHASNFHSTRNSKPATRAQFFMHPASSNQYEEVIHLQHQRPGRPVERSWACSAGYDFRIVFNCILLKAMLVQIINKSIFKKIWKAHLPKLAMPKPLELRKVIRILKKYGIIYVTGKGRHSKTSFSTSDSVKRPFFWARAAPCF
jgi:hypothetical protein